MNKRSYLEDNEPAEHKEPECLIIEDTEGEVILVPIGSIKNFQLYIATEREHMEEIDNLEELKELKECLGA